MAKDFESNRFTWEDGDLEIFDFIEELNAALAREAQRKASGEQYDIV